MHSPGEDSASFRCTIQGRKMSALVAYFAVLTVFTILAIYGFASPLEDAFVRYTGNAVTLDKELVPPLQKQTDVLSTETQTEVAHTTPANSDTQGYENSQDPTAPLLPSSEQNIASNLTESNNYVFILTIGDSNDRDTLFGYCHQRLGVNVCWRNQPKLMPISEVHDNTCTSEKGAMLEAEANKRGIQVNYCQTANTTLANIMNFAGTRPIKVVNGTQTLMWKDNMNETAVAKGWDFLTELLVGGWPQAVVAHAAFWDLNIAHDQGRLGDDVSKQKFLSEYAQGLASMMSALKLMFSDPITRPAPIFFWRTANPCHTISMGHWTRHCSLIPEMNEMGRKIARDEGFDVLDLEKALAGESNYLRDGIHYDVRWQHWYMEQILTRIKS